jgi:hypothetical protein
MLTIVGYHIFFVTMKTTANGNVPERAKGLRVFLLVIVPAEAEILVLCRSSPHDIVVLRQDEAGGFFPRTISF